MTHPPVDLPTPGEPSHRLRTKVSKERRRGRRRGRAGVLESDIELMLRAREGDAAAFAELARRYREPLRRYFAAQLADRSAAEDGVQETFLRLWLLRERYEPSGAFAAYLFRIARHYLL